MAVTVTTDQVEVHDCDSTSDWTGTITLDTETFIEGTGSLSAKISKTTSIHMKPLGDSVDLSDTIIYAWILGGAISQFDTKANGGIRIRVQSGTTPEYGEWYIAGSDGGYEGGWQCLSVRTTTALDNDGSVSLSVVNAVGVVFKVTASASKINCWWDRVAYGTSLSIKGGDSSTPADFDDMVTAENTYRYGIVTAVEDVLMCQGKLKFGSVTAGDSTYFKDTSKIIMFRDKAFGSFYDVLVQGNSTGNTKVFFGSEVSDKGISGCIFNSAGNSKYKFTATDTDITELGVYGCIFLNGDTVALPASSAVKESLNTNFEACAEVMPDTCKVENFNFISSASNAIRMAGATNGVKNGNFISCSKGVNIIASGTYTFDNLIFSGCTHDVNNTSGVAITVNKSNGSNPSTYTGDTVTFVGSVTVEITVIDEKGSNIENAQTAVYLTSSGDSVMNEDTNASGVATETYSGSTPASIYIRIRKSSTGATKYKPYYATGNITSDGFYSTVTLIEDDIAT